MLSGILFQEGREDKINAEYSNKYLIWGGVIVGLFLIFAIFGGSEDSEDPVTEAPVEEEPVVEEPVAEDPVEEPVAEELDQEAEAAEELEPEQITLSGTGDSVTDPVQVEEGLGVLYIEHLGESNFAVRERGGAVDAMDQLLVNEIGAYSGMAARNLQDGELILDVDADGPWEIIIDQPRPNEVPDDRSFSGDGDSVGTFMELEAAIITVDMEHSGDSNFVVRFLDRDGATAGWDSLVANEIGAYSGSTTVEVPEDGVYLFDVEANGPWSIDVTE